MMAVSTAVSGARPQHRAASLSGLPMTSGLALDWANGQAIALTGVSAQSAAFDTKNDRVVYVSVGGGSTVGGCWISVGPNPTAAAAAGAMWISQGGEPFPLYVPAGMLIAAVQGASAGVLTMLPALLTGN